MVTKTGVLFLTSKTNDAIKKIIRTLEGRLIICYNNLPYRKSPHKTKSLWIVIFQEQLRENEVINTHVQLWASTGAAALQTSDKCLF